MQKILAGVTAIITFSVTAAILISAIILVLFFVLYEFLLSNEFDSQMALLTTAGTLLVVFVGLVFAIMQRIRSLHDVSSAFLDTHRPISSHIYGVVSSFIEGLLTPSTPNEKKERL